MTSSPHSLTQKSREKINNNHYAFNVVFFQWVISCWLHKFRTGYLLPTLARKITCQHFDWNLQSSSGQKWRSLKKHCYLWKFSILVEALLWECNLDVQGLFHQQFLSSAMVQHCDLFPGEDVTLPFLETLLRRKEDGSLDVQYLHFESHHSIYVKRGVVRCLHDRARGIINTQDNLKSRCCYCLKQ